MTTFLLVASMVSIIFHLYLWWLSPRAIKVMMMQFKTFTVGLVLLADLAMFLFIGAGNIVGIANLAGGVCLGLWVLVRAPFCKEKLTVVRKKALWVIPYPTLVLLPRQ